MRSRQHHNNHGLRQIQRGNTRRQIAAMAARLGVPLKIFGTAPAVGLARSLTTATDRSITVTEQQLTTIPKSRAKRLAKIAKQQGADIAHLRLLGIESFRAMTDSVKRYLEEHDSSSPNLYVTIIKQIDAACQIVPKASPTRRQLIARAACLDRFAEVQDYGIDHGFDKEEIKRNRKEVVANTAAFFGLGNKASQRGRKAA